jgi:hypothetical protein
VQCIFKNSKVHTRALAFSMQNPELEFGNNLNNFCGSKLKSRDLAGQILKFSNQAMPHFYRGGIYKVFSINLTKFVSRSVMLTNSQN